MRKGFAAFIRSLKEINIARTTFTLTYQEMTAPVHA